MGTIARYLVPIDSKLSAAEYADKAKAVLLQMGVISYPDGDKKVIYNGERSIEPFQVEPGDGEYGFDLGGIYPGPGFIIAPEEYVDEATCPRCNADITDLWMSDVRDEDGYPIQHPSKDVRIWCPHCGAVLRLDEVKCESLDKFYLTDRFVSFWDSRPFKPEWVAEFDRQMECHLEIFDYGWT